MGTENWSKDGITVAERCQVLRIHIGGCASLFVSVHNLVEPPRRDFQTSQGSHFRRFLGYVTQAKKIVRGPVFVADVFCLVANAPATVVGRLPVSPWPCGYANMKEILRCDRDSTLLRKGLNLSPCSSHSQHSEQASSSIPSGTRQHHPKGEKSNTTQSW